MQSMTNYNPGDIIVVPFPFTDQTTNKKRPAVVISTAAYHEQRPDLILMAITSQIRPTSNTIGEVLVSHWEEAGLLKPSCIKPVIATVEKTLILRKLGSLQALDLAELQKSLRIILKY